MIVTEEKAKTKFCPYMRAILIHNGVAVTHNITSQGHQCCIAEDCMMWRKETLLETDKGYCGLAYPPEVVNG